MMGLIPMTAENVVGIRIAGKIEKIDMEKITGVIDQKLKSHQKLRVYVELESFDGISFEALIKDLKLGFSHIGEFEKRRLCPTKPGLPNWRTGAVN